MKLRSASKKGDRGDSLSVYDPRRNEDFEFGPLADGTFVSSRACNFAVIHVTPRFELVSSPQSRVRAAVLTSFELEKGVGFGCAFAAPKHVETALPPGARRAGQGLLGHFRSTANDFRKHFELFNGLAYGELTIGCAAGELFSSDIRAKDGRAASQTDDFELLFVMAKSELVDWLVSFYADSGDALIVAKVDSHVDTLLSKLRDGS